MRNLHWQTLRILRRYTDDDIRITKQFPEFANLFIKTINFMCETSEKFVNFSDIKVSVSADNSLSTSVFF